MAGNRKVGRGKRILPYLLVASAPFFVGSDSYTSEGWKEGVFRKEWGYESVACLDIPSTPKTKDRLFSKASDRLADYVSEERDITRGGNLELSGNIDMGLFGNRTCIKLEVPYSTVHTARTN